jgi:hypothetical protein
MNNFELQQMKNEINSLRKTMNTIKDEISLIKTRYVLNVNTTTIDLPDHLRLTYKTLLKLKDWTTAQELSNTTVRARAVESGYCNYLVTINVLEKKRIGRKVFFRIPMVITNG